MKITSPAVSRIDELIRVVGSTPRDDIGSFASACLEHLRSSSVTLDDILQFLDTRWDPRACPTHWLDDPTPPLLVDLHVDHDWCLRLSLWTSGANNYELTPHSHFGFIATAALTPLAYTELFFESAACVPSRPTRRPFRHPDVRLITPDTIHAVELPTTGVGASLSVRTRAIRDSTEHYDANTATMVKQDSSAASAKAIVLATLRAASPESL